MGLMMPTANKARLRDLLAALSVHAPLTPAIIRKLERLRRLSRIADAVQAEVVS